MLQTIAKPEQDLTDVCFSRSKWKRVACHADGPCELCEETTAPCFKSMRKVQTNLQFVVHGSSRSIRPISKHTIALLFIPALLMVRTQHKTGCCSFDYRVGICNRWTLHIIVFFNFNWNYNSISLFRFPPPGVVRHSNHNSCRAGGFSVDRI